MNCWRYSQKILVFGGCQCRTRDEKVFAHPLYEGVASRWIVMPKGVLLLQTVLIVNPARPVPFTCTTANCKSSILWSSMTGATTASLWSSSDELRQRAQPRPPDGASGACSGGLLGNLGMA